MMNRNSLAAVRHVETARDLCPPDVLRVERFTGRAVQFVEVVHHGRWPTPERSPQADAADRPAPCVTYALESEGRLVRGFASPAGAAAYARRHPVSGRRRLLTQRTLYFASAAAAVAAASRLIAAGEERVHKLVADYRGEQVVCRPRHPLSKPSGTRPPPFPRPPRRPL